MPYRKATPQPRPPRGNFSLLQWEAIERYSGSSGPAGETHARQYEMRRARVPGGWLVESILYDRAQHAGTGLGVGLGGSVGVGSGVGLAFVPDPTREWVLESG